MDYSNLLNILKQDLKNENMENFELNAIRFFPNVFNHQITNDIKKKTLKMLILLCKNNYEADYQNSNTVVNLIFYSLKTANNLTQLNNIVNMHDKLEPVTQPLPTKEEYQNKIKNQLQNLAPGANIMFM
jgi:hypothetical protein